MCFLDRIGKCPRGLIETDPYYTSVVLSNLGSLKLRSGYHHLTNWGTCSLFCIVGEFKNTTYVKEDGTVGVRETVDLGLTVDERLVDGYYYSKTIRLLQKLMEKVKGLSAVEAGVLLNDMIGQVKTNMAAHLGSSVMESSFSQKRIQVVVTHVS